MRLAKNGFTLLEISIALALIGLLAGTVLVSQGFMRRNELRNVVVDATTYTTAMHQFRLKYAALPGDMPNATNVWGALATCPADPSAGGKATCDGNGNGRIESGACEDYRVWQHLTAGEFIGGTYSGISGLPLCAKNSQIGVNSPEGSLTGTVFSISSLGEFYSGSSSPDYFDGDYANTLIFGAPITSDYARGPALTTEAAKEIDIKSDDGSPALGNIRSFRDNAAGTTPDCISGTNYDESYENTACALLFMSSFATRE